MGKYLVLAIIAMASLIGAQDLNYNGWGDTSSIINFKADSLKRSRVMALSSMENCRFDVYADDTAHAGFANDVVKFYWWLEVGHPTLSKAGKLDTVWSQLDPVYVDTFDMTTAANMVKHPRILDSTGALVPSIALKSIDTLSVSGFAVQSREISMPWDVYVRFGFKGLSGNITTSFVKLRAQMVRRIGAAVKVK